MDGAARVVAEALAQRFGTNKIRVFRAPGRVNLIGEHTDYNLGFVLPVALDLACFVASAPSMDGRFRVYSKNLDKEFSCGVEEIGGAEAAHDWSDYPVGVARELILTGFPVEPCDLVIWSTVPTGSGLSSSAALEASTALALLNGRPIDPLELAKLCRRAENNFVGMPCGIMDQYISVFGRENSAIRIDCRNLEYEVAPLPADVEFLAVNSMVKHELGSSAYRQRVAECREAVDVIRRRLPDVESLRDVSSSVLSEFEAEMPVVPMRRALHVVSEDERVEAFIHASRESNAREMGDLLVASHRSLQKDYEVSCEELDFLVDMALSVPGVLGARMTGGGFGGCTVNMMRPDIVAQFRSVVTKAYAARYGLTPDIYPVRPSAGAGEVLD
ncbi:MAG: galactokinase [Bryobacteraceae bacterium]